MNRLPDAMVPPRLREDERTGHLYRWFITCHLIMGLLALGLGIWVYQSASQITPAYWLFMVLTAALLLQPILFRLTGGYKILSLIPLTNFDPMILVG
ncbi:MAG: hypothetical protein H8E30_10180, partial [Alphaproteobacteria bacterium]|nr:hypothetical protein [Alphaproteobacteria bacterium]